MAAVAVRHPPVSPPLSRAPAPQVRTDLTFYVRALLDSESLLAKFAENQFREYDKDCNGLIDRAELQRLCECMNEKLGLPRVNDVDLGRKIARFDLECEGGVGQDQFALLVRGLLAAALDRGPLRSAAESGVPESLRQRLAAGRAGAATASWLSSGDANMAYPARGPLFAGEPLQSLQLSPGVRPDSPTDKRFVRAILASNVVLQQYASSVFRRFDLDGNGQISLEELRLLCEAMNAALGLPELGSVELVGELARFADEFSGSLSMNDFVRCFRHLLQRALDQMDGEAKATAPSPDRRSEPLSPARFHGPAAPPPLQPRLPREDESLEPPEWPSLAPAEAAGAAASQGPEVKPGIRIGDEVWAPFFGDPSGASYRALLREVFTNDSGVMAALTWLRPPEGRHPERYVVSCGRGLDDLDYRAVPVGLLVSVEAKPSSMFCE